MRRIPLVLTLMASLAACAGGPEASNSNVMHFAAVTAPAKIDPERRAGAIAVAHEMRARGKRVWCVPFARDVSGIDLRGNARTWWAKAEGQYPRGHKPQVGAVMAFSASRAMPLGHVAVVSQVVSEREIRIDHANWRRNQVSLGMTAIDVSEKNDWTRVRVEGVSGAPGRVNPVAGFIYQPGKTRG